MPDVKEVRIDGDGIEWNGLFCEVILKAASGNDAAKDLQDCFQEMAGTIEQVKLFVEFPDNGLEQETREGTGSVVSFENNGHEVTVHFHLNSNVTMHKRRRANLR